jgi:hypothetical protein
MPQIAQDDEIVSVTPVSPDDEVVSVTPVRPTSSVEAAPKFGTKKYLKSKFYEGVHGTAEALPSAGGIAGSLVGKLGGQPGAIIGAAAGGAAGAVAERAIKRGVFKEGPPVFSEDTARYAAREGGKQGALEAATAGLGIPLKRFDAAMRGTATTATARASEKYGLTLTPAEKLGNTVWGRVARSVQKFGEMGTFGNAIAESGREKSVQAAEAALSAEASGLAQPAARKAAGETIQKAIAEGGKAGFNEVEDQLGQEVEKYAGSTMVDMRPLKKKVEDIIQEYAPMQTHFGKSGALSAKTRQLVKDVISSQDFVPFKVTRKFRSHLLEIGPAPGSVQYMSKETDSFVKLVRRELTGALEQAAGSFDQRGAAAFKAYNEFYKEGAGVFERSVVADLLNSKPSLLINSVKTVEDAQALKKALEYGSKSSDPVAQQQVRQAWRQFQEQYLQNQLFRTKGAVDLSAISKRLVDKKELLGEIFSDAQGRQALNNVKEISDAMAVRGKLPTQSMMKMYRWLEAGIGILGFAKGHVLSGVSAATALEAAPAAITEVMYNPKAFKFLRAAVHTGSVTAQNSANVMRALAIVNDEYEAQQGPPRPPAPFDPEATSSGPPPPPQ